MNDILEHRKAVIANMQKSFGVGIDCNQELKKSFDDELEKGKWQVGMTKVYQGVTYEVSGFNAKGVPLWRKKKDGGASSSQTNTTTDNGGKTSTDTRKINPDNIGKKIISAMKADQGLLRTDANGKKLLNKMALAAEEFIRNNPKLNLSDDDLQEIVGGDTEPYEKMKGWDKLNRAIDNYIDGEDDEEPEDDEEDDEEEEEEVNLSGEKLANSILEDKTKLKTLDRKSNEYKELKKQIKEKQEKVYSEIETELDEKIKNSPHNDSNEWRNGAYEVYQKYKNGVRGNDVIGIASKHMDGSEGMHMVQYFNLRNSGKSNKEAEKFINAFKKFYNEELDKRDSFDFDNLRWRANQRAKEVIGESPYSSIDYYNNFKVMDNKKK